MSSKKTNVQFQVKPGGALTGSIRVPGDKSISHRSIMLGSLAEGNTEVSGFLEGDDSLATLVAFRSMGVKIEGPVNGDVIIHGVGLHGLESPHQPLDYYPGDRPQSRSDPHAAGRPLTAAAAGWPLPGGRAT